MQLHRCFDLGLSNGDALDVDADWQMLFARIVLHVGEYVLAQLDRERCSVSAEWRSSFSSQRGNEMPSHFMSSSVRTDPQGENESTMGAGERPQACNDSA